MSWLFSDYIAADPRFGRVPRWARWLRWPVMLAIAYCVLSAAWVAVRLAIAAVS